MLTPRLAWIPLLTLSALVPAPAAHAQDSAGQDPAGQDSAGQDSAGQDSAGQETAPTAVPGPRRAAPRTPPPIMVAVLTTGRVPDELVEAARTAVVEQVASMASGRPVHPLSALALRDALAACTEDGCVGALLAEAGAQAGVLVRLTARARRPVAVSLELRDPVSGTPRQAPVVGELPLEPAGATAAARALAEQLRDAMPSPPPRPATLLVTVDVDGARVSVDGDELGTSPVAPVEVGDGPHEVTVLMPGYLGVRRQVRVLPGEQARLDVNLVPTAGASGTSGGDLAASGGDVTGEWWFWTAIGGGTALLVGIAIGIGVAASGGGQVPMDPTGIMLPPIMGGM